MFHVEYQRGEIANKSYIETCPGALIDYAKKANDQIRHYAACYGNIQKRRLSH